MHSFEDRREAGQRLAQALSGYEGQDVLVLALPRGGVPVAAEIAASLRVPLDLLLVRKIGLPSQPELAMGAIAEGTPPVIVRDECLIRSARVPDWLFDEVCRKELKELERRRAAYLGPRSRPEAEGRVVVVVDDGIATGTTVKAALRSIRQRHPKELVLAVPIAPEGVAKELRQEVDALFCLSTPARFGSVGHFYRDFHQLEDQDVLSVLARFTSPRN